MFCPKCGKQIGDNATFCNGCGCSTSNKQGNNAGSEKNVGKSIAFILAGIAIIVITIVLVASQL